MPASESRDIGTWLAIFGLLVLAACLLGLMAMVAPHLLGIVLILAAFVSFGALHYLIWGWWLGSALSAPPPDDTPDNNPSSP